MAFLRFARATSDTVRPCIPFKEWDEHRIAHRSKTRIASVSSNLIDQASQIFHRDFNPDQYLLTHATIIASVDAVDVPHTKLGSVTEDGFKIHRKFADFRVTSDTDQYINNNLDGWSRPVLLASYPTFIGAHNFCEHVQIEDLSKGRIIDAVARDIGESIYVDILVATDKKHRDLIASIENGKMSTLSMGCTVDFTLCTRCGHLAVDETDMCPHIRYEQGNIFYDENGGKHRVAELCFPPETRIVLGNGERISLDEVQVGDQVFTHTGRVREVTRKFERHYAGNLISLGVRGLPQRLRSTPNHPYWVLSPRSACICGCGAPLKKARPDFSKTQYTRSYIQGHQPNQKGISSLTVPDFEFKTAEQIQVGDMLALPIPQGDVIDQEASKDRAILLGWFLAEGSYLKHQGERIGVQFTLNPYDEIKIAHQIRVLLGNEFLPEEKKQLENLTATVGCLVDNPKTLQEIQQSVPLQRRSLWALLQRNPEFFFQVGKRGSCGIWGLRSDAPDIQSYQPKVYLYDRSEGGQKLVVIYKNKQAAEWFFEYAGEYSGKKQVNQKVLFWPTSLQHQLIKAYVDGDGSVDSLGRFRVSSISETLISQMQLIAARCGLWSRRQVIFEGKCVSFEKVVGGEECFVGQDGFRPRHELSFRPSQNTNTFFGDHSSVRQIGSIWSQHQNYFIYRVTEKDMVPYDGPVCNIEVADDHSYLVEGLAVHNCGHQTVDPTGGVNFVEASWVASPAFTGAVLRNVLEPKEVSEQTLKQAQAILNNPPKKWDSDSTVKVAQQVEGEWGDDEEGGGEEAPAEPERSPLDELQDKIEQAVLKRVEQKLKTQLDEMKAEAPNSTESTASPNNTIIHQSARIAKAVRTYQAGMGAIVRTASSSADLLNRVVTFDLSVGVSIPVEVYRTVLAVGPTTKVKSSTEYLKRCSKTAKREFSFSEKKALIRLGKLLSCLSLDKKE